MYSEKILDDIKNNLLNLSWNNFEDKVFIAFREILNLNKLVQITAWAIGSWPWDWKRDYQEDNIYYTVYWQSYIWDWDDLVKKCRKDFNWIKSKCEEEWRIIKKWIFVTNRGFWDNHKDNFDNYKKEITDDLEIEYWDLNIIVSKLSTIKLGEHKNTLWTLWLISEHLIPELIPNENKKLLDKIKNGDKSIKDDIENIKTNTNYNNKDSYDNNLYDNILWNNKISLESEINYREKLRKHYLLNVLILWMNWFDIDSIVEELDSKYWENVNSSFSELSKWKNFITLDEKINYIYSHIKDKKTFYDNEIIKEYIMNSLHSEKWCFYEWVVNDKIWLEIENNNDIKLIKKNTSIIDLL